jgi:hypothetical protein
MPTERWHCQSAPSSGLGTGVGYAKLTETATAVQATTDAITNKAFLFRQDPNIAVTPVGLRGTYGEKAISVVIEITCDQIPHNRSSNPRPARRHELFADFKGARRT